VKNTSLYQKTVDDINRCKSTIESFDEIMDYDDLKLMQLIVSFYKVDYSYYEWFKKMELKDVKETGELYTTHTNTMENANNFGNDILDNNEKIKELNERLEKLKNSLFDFINYTLEFNIKEYEQEKPKKGGLFKKIKPNNKETLLQIFSSFATLSSFINYLEENYKKPEDKSIEVTECFNKYFEITYGNEIEYIEVEKFFLEFQKTILNYLKTKIDDTQKEIVKYNKLNNGAMVALVKSVEKGYNEAILQEMAYNSTVLHPNQLQIKGYTPEELEQMYNSLKEILSNNYLQQEPTTKKKK
jgi:ribosomal protein L29